MKKKAFTENGDLGGSLNGKYIHKPGVPGVSLTRMNLAEGVGRLEAH